MPKQRYLVILTYSKISNDHSIVSMVGITSVINWYCRLPMHVQIICIRIFLINIGYSLWLINIFYFVPSKEENIKKIILFEFIFIIISNIEAKYTMILNKK